MTEGNLNVSGKVGVIFPSRGLVFSRTAQELLDNLKGYDYKIFFSHKLPIPDCFEIPTQRALDDDSITHLWFVEDDMKMPADTLKTMLEMNVAVVTANYPTTSKGDSAILTIKNRIVYAGTGCTLVKREVFNELQKPYFRTDIAWIPKNKGTYIKFKATKKNNDGYGLHDVNFFMNLYKLNIPVHKIKKTLGQRKLVALGKPSTNDGAHQIDEWTKAKEDRYFTLIKNLPVEESGNLVEVDTPTGTVLTSKSHAKKLIDNGLGVKPPKRAVVLDWGDYA